MINIGIKDDQTPEIDEVVLIELYNPTGGSELGLNSQVNIRILANDYVAGILKLATLSYIVKEGKYQLNQSTNQSVSCVSTVSKQRQLTVKS